MNIWKAVKELSAATEELAKKTKEYVKLEKMYKEVVRKTEKVTDELKNLNKPKVPDLSPSESADLKELN